MPNLAAAATTAYDAASALFAQCPPGAPPAAAAGPVWTHSDQVDWPLTLFAAATCAAGIYTVIRDYWRAQPLPPHLIASFGTVDDALRNATMGGLYEAPPAGFTSRAQVAAQEPLGGNMHVLR